MNQGCDYEYFDFVRLSAKLAESEPLLTAEEFREMVLKPGAFTVDPFDSEDKS